MDGEPNTQEVLKPLLAQTEAGNALRKALQGLVLYANPYPLAPLLGQVLLGQRPEKDYTDAVQRLHARYDAWLEAQDAQ
jgi:hypothetical protein